MKTIKKCFNTLANKDYRETNIVFGSGLGVLPEILKRIDDRKFEPVKTYTEEVYEILQTKNPDGSYKYKLI